MTGSKNGPFTNEDAVVAVVLLYLLTVALFYVLLSNQAANDAEKREVEARARCFARSSAVSKRSARNGFSR